MTKPLCTLAQALRLVLVFFATTLFLQGTTARAQTDPLPTTLEELQLTHPELYIRAVNKLNGIRPTPQPNWSKGGNPLTPFAGASPDCNLANGICAVTFPANTSFSGFGSTQELGTGTTCLFDGETNSNWYIFTTQSAGALTFLISPGAGVDFDFALYNITGVGCSAIPTLTPVRCNYSLFTGNTGLVLPVSAAATLSSGAFSSPTMPGLNTTAGQTFALLIDNFDGLAGANYSLTFGSGTGNASVADIIPPTLAATNPLAVNCANPFGQLTITLSEPVDCATIQASDFTITGGPATATVTSVVGGGCGNNTNTITINYTIAGQTGGTYTLNHVGDVADLCGNVMGPLNRAFTLPTKPTISSSATSVCAGGTVTLTASGAPGATFTWSNGSTGASISPTVNATTNFTVTASQPGVCSATSDPITITALNAPVVTVSPAAPAVCSGQTTSITVSVTVGGVPCAGCNITVAGAVGPTSGSGPSFTTTVQQGSVNVYATDPSITGPCAISPIQPVAIAISPAPTAYALTGGGAICAGGTGAVVGLSNSDAGISYQLQLNGGNVGTPVAGTGAAISFGSQTLAGNYTVVATNSTTGCTATMSNFVTISFLPPIAAFNVTGGGGYCAGGAGVPVGLSGSVSGVDYALIRNGSLVTTIPGTGSALSYGIQTQAGDYSVRAISGSCTEAMNDTVSITVNPLPTLSLTLGSDDACIGSQATISVNPSQAGIVYQPYRNGAPFFAPQTGNGGPLDFNIILGTSTLPLDTTFFRILATDPATGCADTLNGRTFINVLPGDTIAFATSTNDVCEGQNAPVFISYIGSLPNVHFLIRDAANNIVVPLTPIVGSSMTLSIPAASLQPGSNAFVVEGQVVGGLCPTMNILNININVNPLPNISLSAVGDTVCAGLSPEIVLQNPEAGVTYSVFHNGLPLPIQRSTVGNTLVINIQGASMPAGSYVLRILARSAAGCEDTLSQVVNVLVSSLPRATAVASPINICAGQSASPAANPVAGQTHNWYADATSSVVLHTGDAMPPQSPSANTTYYVEAVNANGCISNSRVPVEVNVTPLPAAPALRDTLVCRGQPFTLSHANPSGFVFNWYATATSPAPFQSTNGSVLIASGIQQDTTFFVSQSIGACEGPLSPYTVRIVSPAFTPVSDTLRACLGGATSYAFPADPDLSYLWYTDTTAAPFDNRNQAAVTLLSPNAQPLFVRVSRNGCFIGTHRLTMLPFAAPDSGFVVLPASPAVDSLAVLQAPAESGVQYAWEADGVSIGSGAVLNHVFTEDGDVRVRLTATSAQGCITITERVITVRPPADELYLPNAFSPNGDGSNDFFRAYGLQAPQQFQMQIYSRWGVLVYETSNFNDGWDGTQNGSSLPEGVYVYLVKLIRSNGQSVERSGSVTLLR